MITVKLNDVATMTAEDAYYLTGAEQAEFAKPGTYHVVIGSRGEIEDIECIGECDEIEVMSLDEVKALAEGDLDTEAYYEEFYGVNVEDDHVNFGYTEEGYDVWLKIA